MVGQNYLEKKDRSHAAIFPSDVFVSVAVVAALVSTCGIFIKLQLPEIDGVGGIRSEREMNNNLEN